MKNSFLITLSFLFIVACQSCQSQATKAAKQTQASAASIRPDAIATTAGGFTMTAKINGITWSAASIMPPEAAGRIVGYYDKEYIGLPYDKEYMKAGKKITLGPDEAADISLTGVGLATTKNGEMEITKVDGEWAEGKFFFTSSINDTNKIVVITEGFVQDFINSNALIIY